MSYAIGALLAVVTVLLCVRADFERRTFFTAVAFVVATYYVLFAVLDGSAGVILAESAWSLVFMGVALVGFRRSPHLIAAVIAGHGVFDLLHAHVVSDAGVPVWWPTFCMTYDVTAGLLLFAITRRVKTATAAVAVAIAVLVPVSARAQRSDTESVARRREPTRPVIAIIADSSGTELTDFMIPHATLTESGVARVVTVALHAGRVRLRPGTVFIEPDLTTAAFDAANPKGADYVIVPALIDHENDAIAAWIRAQAARGATIVSICEGARTLAKAGVLEKRRATTHWSALEELSKKYPATTWVRDRRYVVDDHVITTSGVSAALPASIFLIERIAGRAAAESMARRVGLASWDPAHHTDAFHLTRWMYVKGAWNTLAPWRREDIGVRVAPGFDEIAFALTVDAISRSIRGRAVTSSAHGAPVTGRQGLRISVDRPNAAIEVGTREIALPSPSVPPASALDTAIAQLTTWYGADAAELISMGMEYPLDHPYATLHQTHPSSRPVQ